MTEPLTITIPLTPPAALRPNRNRTGFQSRFTTKDAEAQVARATRAGITNLRAAADGPLPEPYFTDRVTAVVTVYKRKGGQSWDGDNLNAALKRCVFDVLQAEGIVANDRLLDILPPVWKRDPDGLGYMVLSLTPDRCPCCDGKGCPDGWGFGASCSHRVVQSPRTS